MYKLGFDFCRIIWVSWNRLRRLFACSLSWKILCRIFIISFLNVWMNLTLNLSWLEIVCAHVCVCVCVCARAHAVWKLEITYNSFIDMSYLIFVIFLVLLLIGCVWKGILPFHANFQVVRTFLLSSISLCVTWKMYLYNWWQKFPSIPVIGTLNFFPY
jgi:hypothetical protein